MCYQSYCIDKTTNPVITTCSSCPCKNGAIHVIQRVFLHVFLYTGLYRFNFAFNHKFMFCANKIKIFVFKDKIAKIA
jgi:hypothetical protein